MFWLNYDISYKIMISPTKLNSFKKLSKLKLALDRSTYSLNIGNTSINAQFKKRQLKLYDQ